jgi:hypothetical protein
MTQVFSHLRSRRNWIVVAAVFFACACALAVYRQLTTSPTRNIKDPNKMETWLHQHIPPGTEVDQARHIMEAEGFTCYLMQNESYAKNGKLSEKCDFLYCSRIDGPLFAFVKQHWQIVFVLHDGVVEEIVVSSSLLGS